MRKLGVILRRPVPLVGLAMLIVSGSVIVPAQHAQARTPALSAMGRCKAGAKPDTYQTVQHPGTQVQVTYPSSTTNPDNAIYPGDVVWVTVNGKLRYDATHWTGPAGIG